MEQAVLELQMMTLNSVIKRAMLQDRRARIARVTQKDATAYAAGDLRATMRCLRQLLPYRPKAMPLVKGETGRIATTAQQASDLR
eukprot:3341011-Alexandrium_andersonii.AAC.1